MPETEVAYDMLLIGVGTGNVTFGIPGVRENYCFLKEIGDAQARLPLTIQETDYQQLISWAFSCQSHTPR